MGQILIELGPVAAAVLRRRLLKERDFDMRAFFFARPVRVQRLQDGVVTF
jgi:hypothetical protein